MSLTKEECERALRDIEMANNYPLSKYNDSRLIDIRLITFKKLIEEHFDNPPLKFEELKPNTWVWDNNIKEYRKIDRVNKKYHGIEYFDTYGWFIEFEENRFYRYEVK